MTTIVQWFSQVSHARQAMLDLLTSGVSQHDISVLIGAAHGDQHTPTERADRPLPADVRDTSSADEDHQAYIAITAMKSVSTHRLPAGEVVTAIGPLAEALAQASGETNEDVYGVALGMLGITAAEAQACARQLSAGGALVAVRADPVRETVVYGVFRHAMNPSLNGPRETEGPDPEHEEAAGRHEPLSVAVGGLTSGAIPGGWGTAGLELEGLGDDRLKKD